MSSCIDSKIAGAVATHRSLYAKVVLLESGRDRFKSLIQALNNLIFTGKRHRKLNPDSYYYRYLPPSRIRQFAGSSNVWIGKRKDFLTAVM